MTQAYVSVANIPEKLLSQAAKTAKFLKRRIEFHEANRPDQSQEALKLRYTPLNEQKSSNNSKANSGSKTNPNKLDSKASNLIPELKIALGWSKVRKIGAGLHNLGNTCFLNSVLQCLAYTPPLAEYFLSKQHSSSCRVGSSCISCAMEATVIATLNAQHSSISPKQIVSRLKLIAKHMRVGRQEDAHEFMRYLIDSLYSNVSKTYSPTKKVLSVYSDIHNDLNSSILNRIFGGYLQSQVVCLNCKAVSNTIDKFFDLSLCIQNCSTIEKSIEKFVKPETLSGSNAYNCLSCKNKSSATKQIQIVKTPQILTIQLVRFSPFSGSKINKYVQYSTKLDLDFAIDYQLGEQKSNSSYKLLAVLVHAGHSCNSGHYYCYVRSSNNVWYEMNDSTVTQVSESTVFKQSAYILLYEKVNNVAPSTPISSQKVSSAQLAPNGTSTSNQNGNTNKLNSPSHSKDLDHIFSTKKSNNKRKLASYPEPIPNTVTELNGATKSLSNAQPTSESLVSTSDNILLKLQPSKPFQKETSNDSESLNSQPSTPVSQGAKGWIVTPKSNKKKLALEDSLTPDTTQTSDHQTESKPRKKQNTLEVSRDKSRVKVTSSSLKQTKEMKNSLYGTVVQTWDEIDSNKKSSQQENTDINETLPADKVLEKREKFIKRKLKKLATFVHKRPDFYDAEYDKGKVKKVKKKKKNAFKSIANPFQIVSELNTKAG
ncbi:hypothetical protein BB561_002379 [Smittium simulii]|uniref:Ubiquitin carboxyl-terminal hydrolase n=1 Tax=Smittium simulii TaxID=133385 RepID=A0A2T9YQP2_9FUNG|nr:hypothetical protein BB561_002379 [Smittium simulii]